MEPETIEKRLLEQFPGATILLKDLTGTRDHWQVDITSVLFEGKTLVEQHQMVYKALNHWMNKEIHALAINTSVN